MGKMQYVRTIYEEEEYEQLHDMTNELEVSNKLELVKHSVSLDKTPAELGGKNNEWRPMAVNRKPSNLTYDKLTLLQLF